MSQFSLAHPVMKNTDAEYGLDRHAAIAFFVTVYKANKVFEYDGLQPGYGHLEGALQFLVKHGFFSAEELQSAKLKYQNQPPMVENARVQAALEVLQNFNGADSAVGAIQVSPLLRRNLQSYGHPKIFGPPEKRKAMSPEDWNTEFDRLWLHRLRRVIRDAPKCTYDNAYELLTERTRPFLHESEEQRIFELNDVHMVVQLSSTADAEAELNQLWVVGTPPPDKAMLCFVFDDEDLRARFKRLATKLGWKDSELAKVLIQQFIENCTRFVP